MVATRYLTQKPMISDKLAFALTTDPGNGPNVHDNCFELISFTAQEKYQVNHKKITDKNPNILALNIGHYFAG